MVLERTKRVPTRSSVSKGRSEELSLGNCSLLGLCDRCAGVCEGMSFVCRGLSFVRFSIVFPCFLIRETMFPRIWCPKRDLNSQPTDYKSVALPIELLGHLALDLDFNSQTPNLSACFDSQRNWLNNRHCLDIRTYTFRLHTLQLANGLGIKLRRSG